MFGKIMGRTAIVAAAMCAVAPAHAMSFVFTGNTALYGSAGNSQAVTAGGITATATAWYTATNASNSLPVAAYLGDYGSGLGVTNATEGQGQNSTHTVSNVLGYDFIRLEFSTAVKLTGLTLTGFNVGGPAPNPDTDAWISYGNSTDTFGAGTGTGVNNTGWAGFLARGGAVASGSAASYTGAGFSKVWLIAADRSGSNNNDGFKIGTINAIAAVPEPATWGMLILGFGAVGGMLRRRKVAARVNFA